MWICQCSGVEVFLLGLWVSVAATESGSEITASYRREVVLPCTVSSQSANRVYWQRDEGEAKIVVAVYYRNGDRCTVCDPGYSKRTSFTGDKAHGDFSLSLRNISLTDQGSYHCVIQLHDAPVQQRFIHLKVIAQYSQPNISVAQLGDGHPSNQVELTCSSRGGYPEATVRWVNTTDNSTFPEELAQTETKVDALGLYALTSILRANKSSDSIACHIITSMAKNIKISPEVCLNEQEKGMLISIAATTNLEVPSFLFCLLMSSPLLLLN